MAGTKIGAQAPAAISPHLLEGSRQSFKISEVSEIVGVHHSTIRNLIQRGELEAIRKLRHLLITRRSIENFLNSGSPSR